MAFPHDDLIVERLLQLLASRPSGRSHGPDTYAPLADSFPELTSEDRQSRVPTGELRWESKVRFARLKLVERGLVYPAKAGPEPKRGVWIVTEAGCRAANEVPATGGEPAFGVTTEGVLLGWNRAVWDGWDETYEGAVNMVMGGAEYRARWSVGTRRSIRPGTDAWLLRQGGPHGLLGHGTVVSEPFDDAHFARPAETSRYVEVAFDVLLDEADILDRDHLGLAIPEIAWRHQLQSGNRIPPDVNERLLRVWREYTT